MNHHLMTFLMFLGLLIIFQHFPILALSREEQLLEEEKKIIELSKERAKFYELPTDVSILEITDKLLESAHVEDEQKDLIRERGRRIFVFTYPSDNLNIKGYISFVPHPENYPIVISLRGGNKFFGIPNPGAPIACMGNYTIISTTYRGGMNEGKDEYGGHDVNDVNNLIHFIPTLEQMLNIQLQKEKMFMIGISRGGMQMFLALSRFPELQEKVAKIISLSGLLDIRRCIQDRPDMKKMFIEEFDLMEGVNEEEWINYRDPLLSVKHLRSDLPILIIQSTSDLRVSVEEGYQMIKELEAHGNPVTYWEFNDAEHCLKNRADLSEMLEKWLQE